jgi:acyl transferase domain-containing protein
MRGSGLTGVKRVIDASALRPMEQVPVGDLIEAEAVRNVFFDTESDYVHDDILFIGSIKTIIDHLEGSAGLAGLLKTPLALGLSGTPPPLGRHEGWWP